MFEPTFTLEGPNTYSQGIGEFWKTRDTACVIFKKCKCKHTHQVCIVTSKVPSFSRDNPSLTGRVTRYCQNFRVAHCISAHKAPLNALGTRTELLAWSNPRALNLDMILRMLTLKSYRNPRGK